MQYYAKAYSNFEKFNNEIQYLPCNNISNINHKKVVDILRLYMEYCDRLLRVCSIIATGNYPQPDNIATTLLCKARMETGLLEMQTIIQEFFKENGKYLNEEQRAILLEHLNLNFKNETDKYFSELEKNSHDMTKEIKMFPSEWLPVNIMWGLVLNIENN